MQDNTNGNGTTTIISEGMEIATLPTLDLAQVQAALQILNAARASGHKVAVTKDGVKITPPKEPKPHALITVSLHGDTTRHASLRAARLFIREQLASEYDRSVIRITVTTPDDADMDEDDED